MPEANIQIIEEIATVSINPDAVVETVIVGTESSVQTVTVGIVGPQGPGVHTLAELNDVNVTNKVNKSVLVYDEMSDKFVANDVNTIITITDGGNF